MILMNEENKVVLVMLGLDVVMFSIFVSVDSNFL